MCKAQRMANVALRGLTFSKGNNYNLVAIVERGGGILSIGFNDMVRTHPEYYNGKHDKGIHAEYAALKQAADPNGANLHIFRFRKNGTLGDSRPCPDCYRRIISYGVKKIFYTENGVQVRERITLKTLKFLEDYRYE